MHTCTQCLLLRTLVYYAPAFSEIAYRAKAPTEFLCLLNGLLWRRNVPAEINRRNKEREKKKMYANIFNKSPRYLFFPNGCVFLLFVFCWPLFLFCWWVDWTDLFHLGLVSLSDACSPFLPDSITAVQHCLGLLMAPFFYLTLFGTVQHSLFNLVLFS